MRSSYEEVEREEVLDRVITIEVFFGEDNKILDAQKAFEAEPNQESIE